MSSCSEAVDRFHVDNGNGGYDYDFKRIDKINQRKIKRLKMLCNDIHWEIKNEREEFFRESKHMILHWKGQYPNLQDFFEHDEIDWLLMKFINIETDSCGCHAIGFIKFMASSGCKDKPYFHKSGRPQLLRTTPVHHFVDSKFE
uniref:Uncharacterized protein n=1 Tax=Trichogramma kaykai TaxID=54128 RepID=A0ABD2XH81_9HYME